MLTPLRISKAKTRYCLIDPQFKKAGWNLSDWTQVGFGISYKTFEQVGKPRIAISVDRLNTCVGFWENFEHFNMMPKDERGTRQVSRAELLCEIFART